MPTLRNLLADLKQDICNSMKGTRTQEAFIARLVREGIRTA